MSKIQFGKAQKDNPTPASVSNWFDFFSGLFGILMTAITAAPFIPQTASEIIVYVLGVLIGILQFSKPYFGVKVYASSVPTQDVAEIDDSDK